MYLFDKEIKIPSICIDDFYENPDDVRDFALSLDYRPSDGFRPGKTSTFLYKANRKFYDDFCNKLVSIFFDYESSRVDWEIDTFFQLTDSLDQKKNSPLNIPWVHADGNEIAGLIYLTKNPTKNTGTSIYKCNDINKFNKIWERYKIQQKCPRLEFFKNNITENYEQEVNENNSCFEETISFKNVYNRLIAYDGNSWHGAQNYYAEKEPRLTQVFFVKKLQTVSKFPLQRTPMVKFHK